jgi:hypothetical protein
VDSHQVPTDRNQTEKKRKKKEEKNKKCLAITPAKRQASTQAHTRLRSAQAA